MKTHFTKFLLPVLFTFLSLTAVIFFSCNRDLCKGVVCANGGICNRGQCTCQAGYEGINCETISRSKFIGAWTVTEKGSTSPSAQYPVGIATSNNVTDVLITDFNNKPNSNVNGYVDGDTLYIPNQLTLGKVVFGKGYIDINNTTYGQYGTIIMRYEVIDTATGVVDDYGYYGPDYSNPSLWNK